MLPSSPSTVGVLSAVLAAGCCVTQRVAEGLVVGTGRPAPRSVSLAPFPSSSSSSSGVMASTTTTTTTKQHGRPREHRHHHSRRLASWSLGSQRHPPQDETEEDAAEADPSNGGSSNEAPIEIQRGGRKARAGAENAEEEDGQTAGGASSSSSSSKKSLQDDDAAVLRGEAESESDAESDALAAVHVDRNWREYRMQLMTRGLTLTTGARARLEPRPRRDEEASFEVLSLARRHLTETGAGALDLSKNVTGVVEGLAARVKSSSSPQSAGPAAETATKWTPVAEQEEEEEERPAILPLPSGPHPGNLNQTVAQTPELAEELVANSGAWAHDLGEKIEVGSLVVRMPFENELLTQQQSKWHERLLKFHRREQKKQFRALHPLLQQDKREADVEARSRGERGYGFIGGHDRDRDGDAPKKRSQAQNLLLWRVATRFLDLAVEMIAAKGTRDSSGRLVVEPKHLSDDEKLLIDARHQSIAAFQEVVLITKHDRNGTQGVVLNRPAAARSNPRLGAAVAAALARDDLATWSQLRDPRHFRRTVRDGLRAPDDVHALREQALRAKYGPNWREIQQQKWKAAAAAKKQQAEENEGEQQKKPPEETTTTVAAETDDEFNPNVPPPAADPVDLHRAFSKELGAYVGCQSPGAGGSSSNGAHDKAILLHRFPELRGAVELAPGAGIYRGGAKAAVDAINAGLKRPYDFKVFLGAREWKPKELKLLIEEGSYVSVACAPAVILKQCLDLEYPLWHEILDLLGGYNKEISQLEYLKREQAEKEAKRLERRNKNKRNNNNGGKGGPGNNGGNKGPGGGGTFRGF